MSQTLGQRQAIQLNAPKLCNGTRLQVSGLKQNMIEATILMGCAKGQHVFIPWISLIPSDYPFEFKRLQFPIKPCFAITINKAQGQSLKVAGIDLNQRERQPMGKTTNVVYKEALL